jgi:hypothetical protein
MNLIFHHLRKDIRAQRWLIVLWALVLALKIGVNLLVMQPDYHLATVANFIRSTAALTLTGLILWAVLIVRLIQSEPVTGTTSFWLTRPIPRGVYLPSKLLFILIFLFLPALVPPLLDMMLYQVDAAHTLGAARGLVAWYGVTTILVLWLATFTRSMSEFWVLCIAIVLAGVALLAGFAFARFSFGNLESAEISVTRGTLFFVVLLGGFVVSLLIQHAWRKMEGGFAFGIGAVVVAVLVLFFWPFSLPPRFGTAVYGLFGTLPEPESYYSNTNTHAFTDGWRDSLNWSRDPSNGEWRVDAHFTPAPGPTPGVPKLEGIGASFTVGRDTSIGLPNHTTGSYDDFEPIDYVTAVTNDLPGIQLSAVPPDQPLGFEYTLFDIDADTLAKFRDKIGRLDVSIFGHYHEIVRQAAVPLNRDEVAHAPGEIIHVARLPEAPSTMLTTDDHTHKQPVLAVWTLSYRQVPIMRQPARYYVLVDPEAKTGTFLFTNQSESSMGLNNSLFGKSDQRVYLPIRGDEPLDRMVLYIYESQQKRAFNTELTANDFKMSPPGP